MSTWPLPSPGGNPMLDNRRRVQNRQLDRLVKSSFRIRTPRGRRRKKHLTTVEAANYKALIITVTRDLAAKRSNQP